MVIVYHKEKPWLCGGCGADMDYWIPGVDDKDVRCQQCWLDDFSAAVRAAIDRALAEFTSRAHEKCGCCGGCINCCCDCVATLPCPKDHSTTCPIMAARGQSMIGISCARRRFVFGGPCVREDLR